MIYTRRDFVKTAMTAASLASARAAIDSNFAAVQIGTITYSFRPIDDLSTIIKDVVEIGLGEVELMSNHAEAAAGAPAAQGRGPAARGGTASPASPGPRPPMTDAEIAAARARNKALRDWRLSVSMDKFKDVRKRFETAGIELRILCFNMTQAITDEEIDYAFQMAKALGARAISSTTQVSVSKRIAPFADRHKMMIGFHGHDASYDPNEFATPESFATAMSYSKYHGVNLDIGHFTAANYDPIAYIREHHARITNLHLKDRKKNHGPNVPWGEGDTPIKPVLLLLKKEQYRIPANIEYEYGKPGMDTNAEMSKCLRYCKEALA
jgi:sugar phosphate isomerase/epimerase